MVLAAEHIQRQRQQQGQRQEQNRDRAKGDLEKAFAEVEESEERRRVTLAGPHRDDLKLEIACRAALVGRMVLSTLHTSTPEGAVTRLTDLGVPRYVVDDVLRGVLGQSLDIVGENKRRLSTRFVGM